MSVYGSSTYPFLDSLGVLAKTLSWMLNASEITSEVCLYTQAYGLHILLLTCLSAITYFRRQMSCNRVYSVPVDSDSNESTIRSTQNSAFGSNVGPGNNKDVPFPVSSRSLIPIIIYHLRKLKNNSILGNEGTFTDFQSCRGEPTLIQILAELLVDIQGFLWSSEESGLEHSRSRLAETTSVASSNTLNQCLERNTTQETCTKYHSGEDGDSLCDKELNYTSSAFKNKIPSCNEAFNVKSVGASTEISTIVADVDSSNWVFRPEFLPSDLQIHILSHLHPKDVISFGCVNKSCNRIVEMASTARAIWKNLWLRDFGWILLSWEVGSRALQRSHLELGLPSSSLYHFDQQLNMPFGKEFYFRFGLCYTNYILAGLNTPEQCLLGIHGNIYDVTNFFAQHPGSSDTLLVYSGKDVSIFFDDMGHSAIARRLTRKMCVVVHRLSNSSRDSCGLQPTSLLLATGPIPPCVHINDLPVLANKRKASRWETGAESNFRGKSSINGGTLQLVRDKFLHEERSQWKIVQRRFENKGAIVGDCNVFYDPIVRKWKAWYTDMELKSVFLDIE